jgi:hypothetical protein
MQMTPNLSQFTPEHEWHGGFLKTENLFTESSYTLRIKLMLALFTVLCNITSEELNN